MSNSGEQDFAAECAQVKVGLPMMLIWGDSHGAMLYRALSEAAQREGASVAQFTSSSCPPILDFDKRDRPLCRSINDGIFKKIVELRPEVVVLAHDWPQSVPENSLEKLPETIQKLRAAGVQRIVLVGPVPHWRKALPAEVVGFMQSKNTTQVPDRMRMSNEWDEQINGIDRNLSLLQNKLLFHYVSSLESFCNLDGCLVTLDRARNDFTAFDASHLTPGGASLLVTTNKRIFFPERKNDLSMVR